MFISIVIPTFNRKSLLEQTVPALLQQQVADDIRYEIIFVSNGSTDQTETFLADIERQQPDKLRYFFIPPSGGPAAPRNKGIKEALGDIIIILDDDVLPDQDLVQRYAEHHQRYPEMNEAAIGEAYVSEQALQDPMSLFHAFPYHKIDRKSVISYIYFWTCNISFKRKFMLEKGMFDERFLYNEDIVCGYKLHKNDMQLRFCHQAKGEHMHQGGLATLAEKGRFIGRWIWVTVEHIPEPEIIDRYGVLSPQLSVLKYSKRFINRLLFRVMDNVVTHVLLKLLGAENGVRSKVSDFYYYLIFRGAIVKGYSEAKKEAQKNGHSKEQSQLVSDSSAVNLQ